MDSDGLRGDTPSLDGRLEPGVMLGAYQIERRLGRGGMGVVFLARDTTLHRRVALEVLGSAADDGTARNVLPNFRRLMTPGFAAVGKGAMLSFTNPNNISVITGVPESRHRPGSHDGSSRIPSRLKYRQRPWRHC